MCRKALDSSNRVSEDKKEKNTHIETTLERERARGFSQLVYVVASHSIEQAD